MHDHHTRQSFAVREDLAVRQAEISVLQPAPGQDNEIPLGPRTPLYRFLEMLPGLLSIGIPVTLIVLSLIDLMLGALFMLLFVGLALARSIRGGVDSVRGYRRLKAGQSIDWSGLTSELDRAILAAGPGREPRQSTVLLPKPFAARHERLLAQIAAHPDAYPRPETVTHAVVIAAYNEPYGVLTSSIESLLSASIGAENLVVVFAHEERGGAEMRASVRRLTAEYGHRFRAFLPVEHPAGLPGEIQGKGGNITFAGRALERWVAVEGLDPHAVLVTTLDCDNSVHPGYFDYVSYEFVRALDRDRLSFQPVSLFVNNIWHAPAPMRVIAAGNSLWNLISTVRPYSLRNFASHTQPLAALIDMDFWSTKTIVEDGHQYWRSYFHFGGRYGVVPVHIPIYQDAVLAETLPRTLRAQFRQLCRWAYGASDVPYVGSRMLSDPRPAPLGPTLRRFLLLLDSHVTLSSVAPMLALGGWVPWFISQLSGGGTGESVVVGLVNRLGIPNWIAQFTELEPVRGAGWSTFAVMHRLPADAAQGLSESLPHIIGAVQRGALIGVALTILLTVLVLPRRPAGVPKFRSFAMVAQWVLLPFTLICYNAMSAFHSQGRLLIGAYQERFVVTEKAASP